MKELIEKLLAVVASCGSSSSGKPDISVLAHTFEDELKPLAEKLLSLRDALVEEDVDKAYHLLYRIADPTFMKDSPWEEMEKLCS